MGKAIRSFDGETYNPKLDGKRLTSQLDRVREFMLIGSDYRKNDLWGYMTLSDIAGLLCYPESSVSARLRDLRKPKFGGYIVELRRKQGCKGTWEYRVLRPPSKPEQLDFLLDRPCEIVL